MEIELYWSSFTAKKCSYFWGGDWILLPPPLGVRGNLEILILKVEAAVV